MTAFDLRGLLKKRANKSLPVNLACHPASLISTRIQLRPDQKPLIQLAQLKFSDDTSDNKFDAVIEELHLKNTPVRILLAPGEYQFMQLELPQVPPEELKTAVAWQVKDMLRSKVEQNTLDVLSVPDDGSSLRRASGFVVAAENSLLISLMTRFKDKKSTVEVIDIPEMAQRNFADLLEEPERATAVLSIGDEGAMLTVSQAGVLYFTRNFEITLGGINRNEASRRTLFERLILEVQRSFDVLERQYSKLAVSALWLAPFPFRDELHEQLIETLYVPVKVIELADILDFGECTVPTDMTIAATLFLPLGLALREVTPA